MILATKNKKEYKKKSFQFLMIVRFQINVKKQTLVLENNLKIIYLKINELRFVLIKIITTFATPKKAGF